MTLIVVKGENTTVSYVLLFSFYLSFHLKTKLPLMGFSM